ncbi:RidA family protein [Roseicella aerolata]|uniref:RidA family protein n=1 Tax=Roseicella aerolata TaxID=2883479 RepID=A0A9X1L9E7_9PROT|nr:RidA family protein [Roseicella aerolata]MCB4820312.1 RidA family protein [Roseicella aerolata]
MPIELSNPPTVHKPGAYSHAVLVTNPGRRLVISGQVGTAPDGTIAEGGAAQIDQALANLGAILAAHGMSPANLVKVTVFLTDPALIPAWREKRGAWQGEHRPASTLLIVAGLADPRFVVEVEAEAAA